MNVKYTGPALDYSGYGEANRHDIASLLEAGVDVSVELTRHCLEVGDYGDIGQTIKDIAASPAIPCNIKIIHTTPNIFGRFIEQGMYHIGRVFWETDRLPEDFALGCRHMDEIWTGSEYNAQAIRNAGVDKPIYIIPEAVMPPNYEVVPFSNNVSSIKDYTFYSIFEWTERKNPGSLLEAYWSEFVNGEKVALVIKTYLDNFSMSKRKVILEYIQELKNKLKLKVYPDVYLYFRMLSRDQIYKFHKQFDCFVSAHRGEGWGIPQVEAMTMGKPVISTGCGGIHEYIQDVSHCVPYSLVPLTGNNRNAQWYTDNQKWAQVSIDDLKKSMRYAYENKDEMQKLGVRGKDLVINLFSTREIGSQMLKRLIEIQSIGI